MDGKKTIPAAVRRAGEWALVNASFHIFSFAMRPAVAYALAQHDASCRTTFRISRSIHHVPTAKSVWCSSCNAWSWRTRRAPSGLVMLWCAALQAAAAALALLLPCRRRALAHLALAVTIIGHYMYAVAIRLIVAADPGFLFGRIFCTVSIVFFAGGDLVCLLGLLQLQLGGEQTED